MSLTAILWAIAYVFFAATSIINPMSGVLGYLLEYYMRPAIKWWGDDLPDLRYNLIISVVLASTFLLRRGSLRPMAPTPNLPLRWLLLMLAIMLGVTATVAISPSVSAQWIMDWTKMAILFPVVMAGVIRSRQDFDLFMLAHMLGGFHWGWEAYQNPHRQAGRLMSVGSGDTLHDNAAAAHLLTVLPFTAVSLANATGFMRIVGFISLPFVLNTIILCNSRGSMVGMTVAAVMSFWLVRRGYRMRLLVGSVVFAALLFTLADDRFISRQQTTADPTDNSAQARLVTWRGAFELVKDRPLGSGGRGFHLLSPVYIPDVVESHGGDLRAPHNTYAMVASEWGIAGLLCYFGIYGSAFINLARIKRAAQRNASDYFYWRALAIQLALIAFLVAGTTTDRLYAEAGYWMVALSWSLLRIQRTEAENTPSTEPLEAPAAPGGAPPLPVQLQSPLPTSVSQAL